MDRDGGRQIDVYHYGRGIRYTRRVVYKEQIRTCYSAVRKAVGLRGNEEKSWERFHQLIIEAGCRMRNLKRNNTIITCKCGEMNNGQ